MNIAQMPSSHGGGQQDPNKVIIHSMGEFIEAGSKDYAANEFLDHLGFSAHYLITPSGVIIQTREENQIAYHAKGYNTDSIGIEILVAGVHTYGSFLERIKTPFTFGDQYSALVELCKKYQELPFHTHSELSPGRKFDPGDGFPWDTFLKDIGK